MVTLPTPPTDNLYKFLAISGVLLIGTSVVIPLLLQRQSDKEIAEATLKLREDIKQLGHDNVQSTIQEWHEARQRAKDDAMIPAETRANYDEFKSRTEAFYATLITQWIEGRETYIATLQKKAESFNGKVWWFAVVGGIVGGIMTILGFGLWYIKVQRFQDQIVRAEAAKAAQEAPEPAPSTNGKTKTKLAIETRRK